MMKETKEEMLSQSAILEMGWTKTMINKLLPEPVLHDNPMFRCAAPMKLWSKATVEKIMGTEEYAVLVEKSAKRKASAQKAANTKQQNLEKELLEYLDKIKVEKMPLDRLRKKTIKAKQAWYDSLPDWDTEPRYADTADEDTIKRWEVNYIRHKLTKYENGLDKMFGKSGKRAVYPMFRRAILDRIGDAYPELREECNRQMEKNESYY